MGDKKRFVYPSQTACFSYITILSSYQTIYFCYQQKRQEKERKKERKKLVLVVIPLFLHQRIHLSLTLQHAHCSLWHENLIKLRRNGKIPLQYFPAEPESALQTPAR